MERTKNRALVKGLISGRHAILFATVMGVLGCLVLLAFTNLLTFVVAVSVFLFTSSSTASGNAAPFMEPPSEVLQVQSLPVVGYCAVSNQFDVGALIFFAMMVLWQMPHFFAIALFHFEDYKRAGIPVLPISRGILRTKVHMVLYIIAFIPVAILLTLFGYTGYMFLIVTTCLGLAWLALSIKGFSCDNNKIWGQQMFRLSLVIITVLCIVIPFDRV